MADATSHDRLTNPKEAKLNGWLGEVIGLETSLSEASRKLVSLDRARDRHSAGPIHLGMPIITVDSPSHSSGSR